MRIELLGALDYAKLKEIVKETQNSEELVKKIEQLELEGRVAKVSSAAHLSRFSGDVLEIVDMIANKSLETNEKFIKRVIKMGHDSITDHDYLVFALQNVSPIIEQTIIAERFASFTIKSRREVDFSTVGFYTPEFENRIGKEESFNEKIRQEYEAYTRSLFAKYADFVSKGIKKEDARFVLPYSYHSNIIMGIDAHTLKDMIIKCTKSKYAKIKEIKEFGDQLYKIAKEKVGYIVDEIDTAEPKSIDPVEEYLNGFVSDRNYQIIEAPKLLNYTPNVDENILISSIMHRYQFDYERAKKVLEEITSEDKNFKQTLMRKIAFESDQLDLTQVNFQFQIPLSFAVLTHLTRHRTHNILIPDFAPVVDLAQYKTPPAIRRQYQDEFDEVFMRNLEMYEHFKNDYGICDEDLVYFTLSGNMTNSVTDMDGKTVKHILGLRECSKAQWETREMALGMHREIAALEDAKLFSSILGATCTTQGFCKEGKESCGKILTLKQQ